MTKNGTVRRPRYRRHEPDLIVLGGGIVIGRGEKLLGPARATLAAGLSSLGCDAALRGAVAVAIEGLE